MIRSEQPERHPAAVLSLEWSGACRVAGTLYGIEIGRDGTATHLGTVAIHTGRI